MNRTEAESFAQGWVEAWNRHDIDALLAHFADDVTFTSPDAVRRAEGSEGVIRGKQALRAYWTEGVRRIPDLRFELVGVYVGIATLAINCRNQRGAMVNEILRFDGPLVIEGHGTYLSDS